MTAGNDTLRKGTLLRGAHGSYLLGRSLGSGGFGETWLAHREADGLAVAGKMLSLDRLGAWKALELFEREAKVLAELEHPSIPAVIDYFSQGVGDEAGPPTWFLVQTYVEGRSLRQMIADRGRLGGDEAQTLLRRLLEILDYLHTRHPPVIHRDISPGNVILGADGAPWLVDFGAIQDRLRGETGGSTTIGTFGYVPMEQLIGKARPASDLYALGMTMLVALSHREPEALPFDEASTKVKIDEAVPGLNLGLARALGTMVEPVIGKRPSSAKEALALLDNPAAMVQAGAGVAIQKKGQKQQENAPLSAGTRALGKAAIGLGGLAGGLIYLVFFDSFSETELIQISALWIAPVAFGFGVLQGGSSPISTGLVWSGSVVGLLILFIYGIFPGL